MDVGHSEKGATLVMALITLLILTMLATTSLSQILLEGRMAQGHSEYKKSLNNAEKEVRILENLIANNNDFPTLKTLLNLRGIYHPTVSSNYLKKSFWGSVPVFSGISGANNINPRARDGEGISKSIVELMKIKPNNGSGAKKNTSLYFFRITGWGTGGSFSLNDNKKNITPTNVNLVQTVFVVELTP